jgi:hypothetical protein
LSALPLPDFLGTVCFIEPTSFEFTPDQKGPLELLSRETGKPVSVLIAEALAAWQEYVRYARSHEGTNGSDEEPPVPVSKAHKPYLGTIYRGEFGHSRRGT